MKLWILRPVDDLHEKHDPWKPWYDKVFGFVVRAETEEIARKIAMAAAGNESKEHGKCPTPWIDAGFSTCVELTADGPSGVLMRDEYWA